MNKIRIDSFETVLFNKVSNDFYFGADKKYYEWALIEGMKRLQSVGRFQHWRYFEAARKERKCIRNCQIKMGDSFFSYNYNLGFRDKDFVCLDCFAIILYHQEGLLRIPPVLYSDYNCSEKHPVLCNSTILR